MIRDLGVLNTISDTLWCHQFALPGEMEIENDFMCHYECDLLNCD